LRKGIAVLFCLLISGCSATDGFLHLSSSNDRFRPLETDGRVFYEEGSRDLALEVAEVLPGAIKKVQKRQFGPFVKPVKVYVCRSRESFRQMTGRDVRALTYRGVVYLSSGVFEKPDWFSGYLTHELSHLHIAQHGGLFFIASIPAWFSEGLATFVSDGGGAMDVTDEEAIELILKGRHFVPDLEGGLIFRKTASSYGLKPHMFYRQAGLFVAYIASVDKDCLRGLLGALQRGVHFRKAYNRSCQMPIEQLWKKFVERLREGE